MNCPICGKPMKQTGYSEWDCKKCKGYSFGMSPVLYDLFNKSRDCAALRRQEK